jgi:molecular chaperone GrpE
MPKRRKPKEHTFSQDPAVPANEAIKQDPTDSERAANGQPIAGEEPEAGEALGGGAIVEPPEQAVQRLTGEVETLKDRYLRLAADFDNFKKRMVRERSEARSRAQAEVIANSLDALDDLGRVTSLDPSSVSVGDVLSGVQLVERKLLRELESAGLRRVGQVGDGFDPNLHEAVGALPAQTPEDDGTVAAVLQIGYQFGNALLRPARVHVNVAPEGEADVGMGEEART